MSHSRRRLLDRVEAVLFDLDGTLLDTAPDLVGALEQVCTEENSSPPDFELACRYVSTGAAGLIRLAFPSAPTDDAERLRQRLVDLYATRLCQLTVPYAGIPQLLARLESTNIHWGVVTNKPAALTDPLMEQIGLSERSACIVSGDTLAERKPHPAPILHALDSLNIDPARAAYLGDAPQDIAAGQAAGVATLAVTWGYIIPGQNPRSWGADYTIDHPDELLELTLAT